MTLEVEIPDAPASLMELNEESGREAFGVELVRRLAGSAVYRMPVAAARALLKSYEVGRWPERNFGAFKRSVEAVQHRLECAIRSAMAAERAS